MQLTAATLGAFSKYPVQVRLESEPDSKEVNIKKFGFFQSEQGRFDELAHHLGLLPIGGDRGGWCRHPLAYLVEAADDICYRIVDFEDGFQQGLIDLDLAVEHLAAIGDKNKNLERAAKEPLKRDKINVLRSIAIGEAIEEAARVFIEKLPEIMTGEFKEDLMSKTAFHSTFEKIKEIQVKEIYNNQRILRVEAAGFTVIGGLLEAFFSAVSEVALSIEKTGSPKDAAKECQKLCALIPREFLSPSELPLIDPYFRLLGITDYVCGMTDSYALDLFRHISGISLP